MFIILDTFRKMSERNRYGSFENTSGLIANNAAVKGIGLTRILKKVMFSVLQVDTLCTYVAGFQHF